MTDIVRVRIPMDADLRRELVREISFGQLDERAIVRVIVRRTTRRLNGARTKKHKLLNYESFVEAGIQRDYYLAARQNRGGDIIESDRAVREVLDAIRRREFGLLLQEGRA